MSAAAHPSQTLIWTRPRLPTAAERAQLASAGLGCLPLPVLGTRRARHSARLAQALTAAADAARRIYVSAEAVLAVARLAPQLLRLPAAAVGPHTATCLQQHGCNDVWQPEQGLGAAALMALPDWAPLSRSPVVLFHAPGGVREPFDKLHRLHSIEVYQRYRRRPSAAQVQRLRAILPTAIWLGPSTAIVRALAELLQDQRLSAGLLRPLLVLSDRIATQAAASGFAEIRRCADLAPETLIAASR